MNERCARSTMRRRPRGRFRAIRTEPGVRTAAPASPPAGGAEGVRRSRPARTACAAPVRPRRRGLGGGSGSVWRLSLPGRRWGADWGERVVTGAKIGLRANGGKEIANRKLREALVTGWYGAATTELPPAAWSAEADVGAERRNQVPYRDPSRCRAGRRPAPGTTGHSEAEAGSLKPNGEAAAVRDLTDRCGDRGTPRVLTMPPSRGAWRCKRGRGIFSGRADEAQRWQARRAETVLAATAGRPARRSRRFGRQRKASKGTLAAFAAAPPVSRSEGRIAHHNLATPRPPRGRVTRTPGRGRLHRAPADRRREPGRGAIRHPTYAAQSFISTLRRSNRSLRR